MFGEVGPKLPGKLNANALVNQSEASGTVFAAPAAAAGVPTFRALVATDVPGFGAWVSYTPTWTAASVNPALGNGTLQGWYQVFGKTVMVRITLTIGSTTTLGTGIYSWALPFTASGNFQVKTICGSGYVENSGVAGFQCFPRIDVTTKVQCESPNTTTDTRLADIGPPTAGPVNHPIPFAANDFVRFQFTYESV